MGSEWLIIGYAVLGFMSLYFYNSLKKQNDDTIQENIKKEVDPITFGLQLFCIAIFIFSIIGMGKGIIESYDYCEVQVSNATVTGDVTSFEYERTCFENPNTQDEMFYKLSFTTLYVIGGLFILGFIWQLFVYVRDIILPGLKNRMRK